MSVRAVPCRRPCRRCMRRGLSLLESMLAIAILGGAIAVIGESVRLGTQAATDARELTTAQLVCESTLAELTAGLRPLTATTAQPCETAPDWRYSVVIQQGTQPGIVLLAVTVERDPAYAARPVAITLYRWLLDPELAAQLESEAAEQEAQSQSSSSSSSSSSGGTSGGSPSGTAN